jgi:DNA helicase-2/ATP-dependent DNA helicase PcrA
VSQSEALQRLLAGLSEEQKAAVTDFGRPLMIVAGAGTGKTRVLTSRIVWLVLTGRAHPEEILALTFTDKAAQEMSERLDQALPPGQRGVEVGTFHALCDRLLRRHALEIGLDADFAVLSSAQAKLLLRESLFALPLERYRPRQDPLSYLGALARHFDKAKNEGVTVGDYLAWVDRLKAELEGNDDLAAWDRYHRQKELAHSYRVYQELLEARGYLDFGDQLMKTLELLRQSPHLLRSLRERYRFILVDEFQDTNRTQFELVHLLAGEGSQLTVVGDDDQAIYSFRGASLANLLAFQQTFPEAHLLVLRQNYRSLQPILDVAYSAITHNNPGRLEVQHGLDKRLRAARADLVLVGEEAVEVRTFATASDEADAVAERIEQLLASGLDYSDCALLVRNNRDANIYLSALDSHRIPYRFQGSHGLYERPEIRRLLAFAKLVSNPLDSISCHHLAASPLFGLDSLKLLSLNAYARQHSLPLWEALGEHRESTPPEGVRLEPPERKKLADLLSCLEEMAGQLLELSPRALLHAFLVRSGWMARLAADRSAASVTQARNLARFFDIARAHEALFPQDRLPQLVEHLELLRQSGDSPPTVESEVESSAVTITTIHGSKGLEFPVVFLVGLNGRRFPSWRREELLEFPAELMAAPSNNPEADHVAEERRLFYVALTRAQRLLWLSMAFDEGSKKSQQVSPFLREALVGRSIDFRPQRRSPLEELMRHAAPPSPEQELSLPTLAADKPLRLPWSKLQTYWTCPRQYFYQHVLQISAPSSHQMSFGDALHEAIESMLMLKQRGVWPSLEEVLTGFRTRWRRVGYLSPQHQEADLARGLEAIERFWRSEPARPTPRFVERDFRVHLGDNNWLTGKWDRVDEVDGEWFITDYKSGDIDSQERADQRARESKQLILYALALQATVGQRPVQVTLEFLGADLRGRAEFEERDFSRLRGEVRRAARGIRQRDYTPQPGYKTCQFCAFSDYCDSSTTR